jgi:hypothetical protein
MAERYEDCVFLNLPFDLKYEALLRTVVFTVHDCGFVARCAREIDNSGQVRLEKIYDLVRQSKYGIHDLSRTGLDRAHRLPRFNMPLELGIFLGAAKFGSRGQRSKACLILDRDPHRYLKFCSDLAGHDIRAHDGRVEGAIRCVRDWLSNQLVGHAVQIPSSSRMVERYRRFRSQLPALCSRVRLVPAEVTFNEYRNLVIGWLRANPV